MDSTRDRDDRVTLTDEAASYRLRRGSAADARRPRRRRADATPGQPAPMGEALLAAELIDRETLDWALARQAETGERLGQILLAAGLVHRLDLQRALGEQWSLPISSISCTRRSTPPWCASSTRDAPRRGLGPGPAAKATARSSQPASRRPASLRKSDPRAPGVHRRRSTCEPRRRWISSARSCSASASTSCAARPANSLRGAPSSQPPAAGRAGRRRSGSRPDWRRSSRPAEQWQFTVSLIIAAANVMFLAAVALQAARLPRRRGCGARVERRRRRARRQASPPSTPCSCPSTGRRT